MDVKNKEVQAELTGEFHKEAEGELFSVFMYEYRSIFALIFEERKNVVVVWSWNSIEF